MNQTAKYLPAMVKPGRHQVIHRNCRVLVYAHTSMWKTLCGWNYYGSSYEFVEGDVTMVSCAKCISTAQSKEVDKAVEIDL